MRIQVFYSRSALMRDIEKFSSRVLVQVCEQSGRVRRHLCLESAEIGGMDAATFDAGRALSPGGPDVPKISLTCFQSLVLEKDLQVLLLVDQKYWRIWKLGAGLILVEGELIESEA